MNNIAVITTFPDAMWDVYAKEMLKSYVKFWPKDVALLVQLDTDKLQKDVESIIRETDGISVGWSKEHSEFVARNKHLDDKNNYRKQATRFCHKIFAIYRAYDAIKKQKAEGGEAPRYLIWLDADVITTEYVTHAALKDCLPKEGDAVAYLGRKDWPHSECGWLAFDLEKGGNEYIEIIYGLYTSNDVMKLDETHDSWVFDFVRKAKDAPPATNLTDGKPGMDIWPHSPMSLFSTHHKGPVAKNNLVTPKEKQVMGGSGFQIQTKNSIPHEEIRAHIAENQKLIKHWVSECELNEEQIVVVSAGPQMYAEDVLPDYNAGKKVVAVKHAIDKLAAVGIKPWACILLDPRPHVYNFVQDPDKDAIWFVASQVNPKVVMKLLAHGCKVIGYHAAVGADEDVLTSEQPNAVISGGSATATRGLFLLRHLGFHRFKLFGYDLCYPDKVDLNAADEHGQPKYLEISIGWNNPFANTKRCFWTEPQLLAQFEEMNQIIRSNTFELEAHGQGIIPFVLQEKRVGELRQEKLKGKITKHKSYKDVIPWTITKKETFLTKLLKVLPKNR